MCPHTPETTRPKERSASCAQNRSKKPVDGARGRREQAQRRTRGKEDEALERREDAERWMRGERNP